MCTDLCEHCLYIETGDFMCEITHKVCIEDWMPKVCKSPEEREVKNDRLRKASRYCSKNIKE